jgi:hypothetical protein
VRTTCVLAIVLASAGCGRSDIAGDAFRIESREEAGGPSDGATGDRAVGDDAGGVDDSGFSEAARPSANDANARDVASTGTDDATISDAANDEAAVRDATLDSPATCNDGVRDGDETDVDCGGSCAPCWRGQGCLVDSDCNPSAPGCDTSHGGCACDGVSQTCAASRCVDHKWDDDESDVDCGAPSALRAPSVRRAS